MSDSIVKLLMDEYRPDLLDAIERAPGVRLGGSEMESVGAAVDVHLTAALRRAYEMGYREALAARVRAEAAKATVAVLAEESIGFAPAPPPEPRRHDSGRPEAPRDASAERVIAEMRALVTHWGEAPTGEEPPKREKLDLSLFGSDAADEEDDGDGDDAGTPPAEVQAELDEEAEEVEDAPETASFDSPEPADTDEDYEEDEADEDDQADAQASPRVRRTNAELGTMVELVYGFIKANPGTKARLARDALGLDGGDWQAATKRLSKARRIIFAGETRARVYFPVEETKRGKPKKITKSAFILTLPADMPAAEIVTAGKKIGLELDERTVYGARTAARRRKKQAQLEERVRAITSASRSVDAAPRDPEAYRSLLASYASIRRADGAWLACQALLTLGAAQEHEQVFFETRYTPAPAPIKTSLTRELRARYIDHPGADPRITVVVDYLLPALLERYGRPTVAQGYTDAHRLDPAEHSLLGQTLAFAARVLGLALPPVYLHGAAPFTLFSIHGDEPSIGLGIYAEEVSNGRDAAFFAGNQLSYYLPGHYARRLVPQEAELRRWVDAAIALARGATDFAHLSHLEQIMLQTQVDPEERAVIRDALGDIEPHALDLGAWFKAVDATADRVGLLLGHDLQRIFLVLRGGEGTGDETMEARLDALRAWSVSEDYLAVRAALGIAVE
jgi:hypothetical protein